MDLQTSLGVLGTNSRLSFPMTVNCYVPIALVESELFDVFYELETVSRSTSPRVHSGEGKGLCLSQINQNILHHTCLFI